MTPDMMLTMAVLVFVVFLFVSEWVRVDVVGILMMVVLPLIGLVIWFFAGPRKVIP